LSLIVSNSKELQAKTLQTSVLVKVPPCLDRNRFFASSPRLMAAANAGAKAKGDCVFCMDSNIFKQPYHRERILNP
jgi:hypothetical protein